eukprot:2101260-Rhodomonas_salina.6
MQHAVSGLSILHLALQSTVLFCDIAPGILRTSNRVRGSQVGLAELKLNGNVLSGHLPPEWASLPRLRVLDLSDNRLEGPLPREWGPGSGLRRLESVRLDQNRLSGTDLDMSCG